LFLKAISDSIITSIASTSMGEENEVRLLSKIEILFVLFLLLLRENITKKYIYEYLHRPEGP